MSGLPAQHLGRAESHVHESGARTACASDGRTSDSHLVAETLPLPGVASVCALVWINIEMLEAIVAFGSSPFAATLYFVSPLGGTPRGWMPRGHPAGALGVHALRAHRFSESCRGAAALQSAGSVEDSPAWLQLIAASTSFAGTGRREVIHQLSSTFGCGRPS